MAPQSPALLTFGIDGEMQTKPMPIMSRLQYFLSSVIDLTSFLMVQEALKLSESSDHLTIPPVVRPLASISFLGADAIVQSNPSLWDLEL